MILYRQLKENTSKRKGENKMTEEQKQNIYKSYLGEIEYEFGSTEEAMSYEEFCEDCDKYGWDFI